MYTILVKIREEIIHSYFYHLKLYYDDGVRSGKQKTENESHCHYIKVPKNERRVKNIDVVGRKEKDKKLIEK